MTQMHKSIFTGGATEILVFDRKQLISESFFLHIYKLEESKVVHVYMTWTTVYLYNLALRLLTLLL